MDILKISEKISYIPASSEPLSADIGIIREGEETWLFDVGAEPRSIEGLPENAHVVLSHFHRDHTENLPRLKTAEVFGSDETLRHTGAGEAVRQELSRGGLRIFPLPSSHCKGCLGLEVDETYAFVGDALYGRARDGFVCYNVTLLKAEIDTFKQLKAPWLLVSHHTGLLLPRENALMMLEGFYRRREKDDPEIRIRQMSR